MIIPRLHLLLLDPVLGKSMSKRDFRRIVGSHGNLSKWGLALLERDAVEFGIAKRDGRGWISFKKIKII